MEIALFSMNMGVCATPDGIREIGTLAESLGYESLWAGEHIVLPRPRTPESPAEPDTAILDPSIALTFLAASTRRIRLGTGVIVLPQRNPLVLAKELASLDVLSGGRLIVGIGVGYLEPELTALGVPMSERAERTTENLAALRALWEAAEPEFTGRHVAFSGVDAYPRPLQRPLPIVVGGHTRAAHRRAVASGDGWYGFFLRPEQAAHHTAELARAAEAAGRDEGLEISVTPRGALDAAAVRSYAAAGVHRLVLMPAHGLGLAELVEYVTKNQPARLLD